MTIKEQIYNYIVAENGGVSFAELQKRIENWDGSYWLGYTDKNIWLWGAMSLEVITAIQELSSEKKIKIRECPLWIYIVDGLVPDLPLAKQIRVYKKEHWFPVVFTLPHQKGEYF